MRRQAELWALQELHKLQMNMKHLTEIKRLQRQLEEMQKLKLVATPSLPSDAKSLLTPLLGSGNLFLVGISFSKQVIAIYVYRL